MCEIAVKQNGWALEHCHASLRRDRNLVLEAVQQKVIHSLARLVLGLVGLHSFRVGNFEFSFVSRRLLNI
jgi:hypothetical protein